MTEKQRKKILLKEKGITLIALVVTIILLLILAVATLSIALSENGLFSRTRKAAEKYKLSQKNETSSIAEIDKQISKYEDDQINHTLKVELKVNESEVTGTEIPVTAKVTKIEGGEQITEGITYEFYKNNQLDGTSTEAAIHTFKGLDQKKEYTIKVKAKDSNGEIVENFLTIGVLEIYCDHSEDPACLRYTVGMTWDDFLNSDYSKKVVEGKELKKVSGTIEFSEVYFDAIGFSSVPNCCLYAIECCTASARGVAVPSCSCGKVVEYNNGVIGSSEMTVNDVWNQNLYRGRP